MRFVSIEEAKAASGVRLIVSKGIPVPWSEAAKGLLHVKGIEHVWVAQIPAMDNPEIEQWTGKFGAPVLVVDDEPPIDRWAGIVTRVEQLQPDPPLLPRDEEQRSLMYGYIHSIMEPGGYVWSRRLWLNAQDYVVNDRLPAEIMDKLRGRYGVSRGTQHEVERQIAVLTFLGQVLQRQRARGSRYFIGDAITAADIYWATACALFKPLPQDVCDIDPGIRHNYAEHLPEIVNAVDPILVEHRDFIYAEYLQLPMQL